MKTSSQYGFDAMDLNAHISCGYAHDIADRFSFQAFEIKEHELAIKWLETMDQFQQPLQCHPPIRVAVRVCRIRSGLDLLQTHKR